jgi:colanic acid biosynthesis glycosyl transferase WcaI
MRILILNQAFFPDVVSTAQHAADLARKLAAEGSEVHVVCSRRAYDSPGTKFCPEENWECVSIHRVACMGLGKGGRCRRAIDFASFMVSCLVRLCTLGRFDCVVALTSPPLISAAGWVFARLTNARLVTWLMDINPDEAVAAGWLRRDTLVARVFEVCLRISLRGAARIVVLDRFMRDRIAGKGIPAWKVSVIPPWTHNDALHSDPRGRTSFRQAHGLSGKFVVMYSGNHSPCHPLDSLLEAAWQLRGETDIAFCFIGGGSEFAKVGKFAQERHLVNITCLPYQPLIDISASLCAADLHTVVMGDPFVGIVHPCKIYNVMSLGIPVLYIGPADSHIGDLGNQDWLLTARHGDVTGIARHILEARRCGPKRYPGECLRAGEFGQEQSLARLADAVSGRRFEPASESDRDGTLAFPPPR